MIRKPLIALAVASLLAGCAAAPPVEKRNEAAARMQMGISYLRQNNVPMAMRELAEASRLDPGNAEIDLGIAFAYQARGDHKEAERHFRTALRKRPGYAEAHNGLGSSLSFLGRSDEALREFEAAARDVYYTTPELAWFNMGEEYRRLRQYAKADEMYGNAIRANGDYIDAYRMRAAVRGEDQRWEEAAETLEAAVGRNPGHAHAWFELGRVYVRLGRSEDARKAFRNATANTSEPALRRQAADHINLLDAAGK